MAVAYTQKLSNTPGADFDKTLATLGQMQARKAAEQNAIVKQMEARQKASDKLLSETKGYDVSLLMPQIRPLFEEYVNEQMQDIYNFSIDDPVKARQAVNNVANFFNTYSGHLTDEVKEVKELHYLVANDQSKADEYNESLAIYLQSDASPQTAIQAQQIFDGRDIVTQREGGKVFYKGVDPTTGEEMGEWSEITTWDKWANPATFNVPTKSKFGTSPAQVGSGYIFENIQSRYPDEWNRDAATKLAEGFISAGSANEEATSVRAWGVENLFGNSYRQNESLWTAYITADINNPIYSQNEDYFKQIDKEIVNIMVDNSKYPPKEKDTSKLSEGEKNQTKYLSTMRREKVKSLEGLAVDVKDPTTQLKTQGSFGALYSGVQGSAQAYTLPKGLTLTNVDNPLFGALDEMDNVIEGGEKQIIEVENVRKPMFIPASEEYPQGIMVLRDVSVGGVPQNLMIFNNEDQRDRTVVQQVIQEIAQNSGQTGLTFESLANGWGLIQDITPNEAQNMGPFNPNAYKRVQR